ncbi:MAG: hypothetical protein ACOC4E_01195 [Patescibacteria group bacterium]
MADKEIVRLFVTKRKALHRWMVVSLFISILVSKVTAERLADCCQIGVQ